jgi:hypothetical protein
MSTDRAAGNPLEPLLQRAELAARTERPSVPSVHAGVALSDWLVLSGDDSSTGDRGRWIASDTVVDCAHDAR